MSFDVPRGHDRVNPPARRASAFTGGRVKILLAQRVHQRMVSSHFGLQGE